MLFCRTYLPGFRSGGPVRTLANLIDALGDEYDFRVVTLDRDWGSNECYPGVDHDRSMPVGKAHVHYLDPARISPAVLRSLVRMVQPSLIYLNSLFDLALARRVLLLRRFRQLPEVPVLLAPRGQLNPGALELKAATKRAYLALLRHGGLLDCVHWQATGEPEAQAIREALGEGFIARNTAGLHVAPNISCARFGDPEKWQPRASNEPLRIVMLGRVAPMKNVDFAIKVLAAMEEPARLDILGPLEDADHLAACREAAKRIGPRREVHFRGPVEPADIPDLLASYDCFLSPTRGENFGHAIAEALSSGLPAIISDRTPWQDLAKQKAGEVIPLGNPVAFAQKLDELARMPGNELRQLHRYCIDYAKASLRQAAILDANRALLDIARGRGESELNRKTWC
ncbi:glycosyltransferase family 4 protein [Tsuneonella deserti]|nr:glycosyltransferase family 4 protein [Tsuneonella deserti]